jgi:hypothetical protein
LSSLVPHPQRIRHNAIAAKRLISSPFPIRSPPRSINGKPPRKRRESPIAGAE